LAAKGYTSDVSSAVVVVIFTVSRSAYRCCSLSARLRRPGGEWALPGGVLREGESLDGAAARKLADETGVSDVFLEQLYNLRPVGDGRAEVVVTYFALGRRCPGAVAHRPRMAPGLAPSACAATPGV